MDENWRYCPRCGYDLKEESIEGIFEIKGFEKILEEMREEMKEMDKIFNKNIEVFDLSPVFKFPKTKIKGFTIKITSSGSHPPKVYIKTFGDQKKQEEIKPKPETKEKRGFFLFRKPSKPEEPETHMKRLASKFVVEVKLPGVKEEDIQIMELENSVEIRAAAKDKTYFKILTKPPQYRLTGKSFKDGVLTLEFS